MGTGEEERLGRKALVEDVAWQRASAGSLGHLEVRLPSAENDSKVTLTDQRKYYALALLQLALPGYSPCRNWYFSVALQVFFFSVTTYHSTTNVVYHPQNTAASKACEAEAKAQDRT